MYLNTPFTTTVLIYSQTILKTFSGPVSEADGGHVDLVGDFSQSIQHNQMSLWPRLSWGQAAGQSRSRGYCVWKQIVNVAHECLGWTIAANTDAPEGATSFFSPLLLSFCLWPPHTLWLGDTLWLSPSDLMLVCSNGALTFDSGLGFNYAIWRNFICFYGNSQSSRPVPASHQPEHLCCSPPSSVSVRAPSREHSARSKCCIPHFTNCTVLTTAGLQPCV